VTEKNIGRREGLKDFSSKKRDLPPFWWKKFHLILILFGIILPKLFPLLPSFGKNSVTK
jgi:hypothetical protein